MTWDRALLLNQSVQNHFLNTYQLVCPSVNLVLLCSNSRSQFLKYLDDISWKHWWALAQRNWNCFGSQQFFDHFHYNALIRKVVLWITAEWCRVFNVLSAIILLLVFYVFALYFSYLTLSCLFAFLWEQIAFVLLLPSFEQSRFIFSVSFLVNLTNDSMDSPILLREINFNVRHRSSRNFIFIELS